MKWENIFNYAEGRLIWKHRPVETFKTKSAWANTNARFEGHFAGRKNCSRGTVTYIQVRYEGKIILAHRIIWEMHFGEICDGLFIDHVDGNGLNNIISNLRLVDRSGNARNYPRNSKNTSGFTGVYFVNSCQKWGANIYDDGRQIHLGVFPSFVDACKARLSEEKRIGYHSNHGREQV